MNLEKPLNPNITRTVAWLQEHGFNTCDSGDGKTHDFACDVDRPYIHIIVNSSNIISEAQRLAYFVFRSGQTNAKPTNISVEASYNPMGDINSASIISLWGFCDDNLI